MMQRYTAVTDATLRAAAVSGSEVSSIELVGGSAMPTLNELLPTTRRCSTLEPEQLAGYLLEHLARLPEGEATET